jgi:hypothetical protein
MGQAGGAIAADAPVSLIGKSGTRTDTELVATLKCAYRVTAWPEGGLEAPSESVHSVLKAIDPYGFGLHSPPLVWRIRPVLNYL